MNNLIKNLITTAKRAQVTINSLNPEQKSQLEEGWDIEHAYYSSVLEGSKLDRKEFEVLAQENL
ncbi:MAG: hypothetical protein A3D99_00810 [Candidatus Andersenbacteria bacterium RIFCSPHIGHO2_12_FULL_45_11]|uniref:Uncharacterized protein n=1 Tax=Candidatus Andersenbacteria bacterium RIFCSPHIGHO2_12_FULL_45_11 TaxID=1797281 RepID=A0A1G1X6K3_9BACT|nr:MAG: hypothetical protein A3D99_00810 [Candidatus Andersenbacteria bacterium RIFCSPHIGHO2_12_FULL_45_11]